MRSKVQSLIDESNKQLGSYTDKQNEYFISQTLKSNGNKVATEINNNQGKKNAESGHMTNIQKIGCVIGGTVSGNKKTKKQMKTISKLGNEANQQKHGIRVIATNLITGECWEYISIGEAERDTDVQAPTIRKIIRGEQSKTKSGWTFAKK